MQQFTEEQITDLYKSYQIARMHSLSLFETLTFTFPVRRPGLARLSRYGAARQLRGLMHALERVFELFPPDEIKQTDKDLENDLSCYINMSFIQTIACLDALAAIWIDFQGITKPNGGPIPPANRILYCQKRAPYIWKSYPENLRTKLDDYQDWYDQIAKERHAIAHSSPGYVPAVTSDPDAEAKYNELQKQIYEEIRGEHNDAKIANLKQKQDELYFVGLIYQMGGGEEQFIYHSQLIANARTVNEIADGGFSRQVQNLI